MEKEESILVGKCDNIVILRIYGKGDFINSQYVKDYIYNLLESENPEIIIDLSQCSTMDSTFMGTLAGISSKLMQKKLHKLILLNMNSHIEALLKNLGLLYILDSRNKIEPPISSEMKPIDMQELSKTNCIIHMIEAHEKLIEADSKNEVKFESVLNLLKKKLNSYIGNR